MVVAFVNDLCKIGVTGDILRLTSSHLIIKFVLKANFDFSLHLSFIHLPIKYLINCIY